MDGFFLSPVTEMVHPSVITDLLPVSLSFSGFFFFFLSTLCTRVFRSVD